MIARVLLAAALALPLAAGAAGAASLPFLGGEPPPPPPAPPRPVVTEIVADSSPATRSFPGVIAARTEVQMAFQTLGRIVERPVDVGDRVKRGELLARLDPEDLAGNVRAAEAGLSAAEVNLKTMQNTESRVRALAERNVASRAQLEQAEQGLAAAQSTLEQARAELERARDAESYAVMTSPIDGVVSAVRAASGAVVAAGDPIMVISSEADLQAAIDLTETQLAGVERGTPFLVEREWDGETPIRGTVDRIDPVADAATRTRRVHIDLPGSTGLRLGSLIRARRADTGKPELTVPQDAVVRPEGGGNAVWVVARDGDAATVALRAVTLGNAAAGRVPVTQGLDPGAEVVIRGVHSLTEGQAVGRSVKP